MGIRRPELAVGIGGRTERMRGLALRGSGSIKNEDAADLNFPHLQRLPFSTFVSSSPLPRLRHFVR